MRDKITYLVAAALFGLNILFVMAAPGALSAEKATEYKTCGCDGPNGDQVCVEFLYDECEDASTCDFDCSDDRFPA